MESLAGQKQTTTKKPETSVGVFKNLKKTTVGNYDGFFSGMHPRPNFLVIFHT